MNGADVDTSVHPSDPGASGRVHLDFLGHAPCLFKRTFKESFDKFLDTQQRKTGASFKCYVPYEWSSESGYLYEDLWKSTDIDEIPDAIASMGFGDFLRKGFVDRLASKGHFESVRRVGIGRPFAAAGLIDPLGWYTVYAAQPFVMLIDKRKLAGLSPPKRWCDLLEPRYRGKIIISGRRDQVARIPLLYFLKEHGEDGLRRLAANICDVWSTAQIAKLAGSSDRSGAPIYLLSWFFAKSCPRVESTSIIWPEDGALTNPAFLLVKAARMKELAPITDFMVGPDLGRKCALACLPSLHPEVDNGMPEGASFKWLGWDFIRSHDTFELAERALSVFVAELPKAITEGNR